MLSRRKLLQHGLAFGGFVALAPLNFAQELSSKPATEKMSLGLVTYNWGADWDLPTLLENCRQAKLSSVELRVDHKHNVSPTLSAEERKIIARMFKESEIELVGFGTNYCFHSPDAKVVQNNIDGAKQYVLLSKECGATGVKVKPDALPKEIDKEKTIAQIAAALNVLGKFAGEHGQEIRLEIHGGCAEIPVIKSIIDQVTEKSVGLCWNCNKQDLSDPGLKTNFESVRARFGRTVHIRDLASTSYPTKELFELLRSSGYCGHLLIEEGDQSLTSEDRMQRLAASAAMFTEWSQS